MRPHVTFPAALLALSGCGGPGAYVWVDDLASKDGPGEGACAIRSGDLVSIRVFAQDALSTRARVTPTGIVSLPLAGEMVAEGLCPRELAQKIEEKLKPFIVAPSVAVNVDEIQLVHLTVLGEVTRPGAFTVRPGVGVVEALALAGGLTEYADRDRIFVLRPRPTEGPLRIRLTYKNLTRGIGRGPRLTLEPGDAVVVE